MHSHVSAAEVGASTATTPACVSALLGRWCARLRVWAGIRMEEYEREMEACGSRAVKPIHEFKQRYL